MTSTVHISKARLLHNLGVIRAAPGEDAEVLAVVKADGYGHGAVLCAEALREACGWFGVTDVAEGIAVRQALRRADPASTARILVMCGTLAEDAAAIVAHDLTPAVWTAGHVRALSAAAFAAGNKPVRVHVEVDTGMSRQGAAPADLGRLLDSLDAAGNVVCEGLFGHLPSAEVAGAASTATAEAMLGAAFAQTRERGLPLAWLHLENTPAVDEGGVRAALSEQLRGTGTRRMVRTGLALYGDALPIEGAGAAHARLQKDLQPVMTWTAPIIGVRAIAAGTAVGYGSTFRAGRAMRLALLPVGYADGFRREASSGIGNGWVMLGGQRAAVVGRVSMNLTVVDATDIPTAAVGDSAVLLGEGVTADDHARWAGTIAYDILCGVRGRRVLVA